MPDAPRASSPRPGLHETGSAHGDDQEIDFDLEASLARNIMNERDPEGADRPEDGVARSATEKRSTDESVGTAAPDTVAEAQESADETASLLKQLTIGTVIDGKYKIDEIIGRGAMGVVVAATHVHLRERTALKFLSTRAHAQADDFRSRFRREAQVSAKLRNEHITRVIDVGVWREKVPFMVMDHLVGYDLRRTLKTSPQGRLPVAIALDYIVQVCEGLAEAHANGIVHRDLKPSNLFVTKRPDGTDLIKILDFGISKWTTHEEQLDELTQTGVVLGSPKYMSPEQLFGSAAVDPRADIWSIGAIFYEMLTGKPPFDFPTLTRICAELAADRPPPSLTTLVPDVPAELEAVVLRCFVRDRDHRMNDVAELAGSLLEAVEAPFASQVRSKIGSMLDPKGQSSPLSTSSSGAMHFGTGDYRSLSISGSRPSISSGVIKGVEASGAPASMATAGGVEALTPSQRPETGKKRVLLLGVGIGLLLGVGGLVVAFAGKAPEAKGTPTPPASALGAQVAPTPTAPPPPTAAVPATGTPPAPVDSATAAPTAAIVTPPVTPPRGGGGGGGHVGHRGGGGAVKPPPVAPPPVTATAAAPAPTPTPAPAPTPKVNPLEDRQ